MVYQLAHPWHWLTYGQNAAGVAAIAAIVALIGLYFYTQYTREMMKMQEATARASITPILVMQGQMQFEPEEIMHSQLSEVGVRPPIVTKYKVVLRVRNVGEGAALFIKAWHQQVSERFVLSDSILSNSQGAREGHPDLTELIKSESTPVTFFGFAPEDLRRRWLLVVDAIDPTNLRHQLQIQRTPVSEDQATFSIAMVHENPLGTAKGRPSPLRRFLMSRSGHAQV